MKPIIAIPAISALVYRAYSKKSLTTGGILAATLTAIAHAVHPWNLPFVLLAVFFLAATRATHVKEDVKAKLTVASKGTSGGEGPRTHVQVFANSFVASALTLLHAYQLHNRKSALLASVLNHNNNKQGGDDVGSLCFSWPGDLLVIGIIANYAAVAADTFSSELGILAKAEPRLITSWRLRKVPRGTNGGVTLVGLAAGLLGSMIIVTAAVSFLPFCNAENERQLGGGAAWTMGQRRQLMVALTLWGVLGSLLDSVFGALFQRSVKDVRTGKIVEGEGGVRVLVSDVTNPNSAEHFNAQGQIKASLLSGEGKDAVEKQDEVAVDEKESPDVPPLSKYDARNRHRRSSFGDEKASRVVESGLWDLLDNNDVNFLMALTMSFGAMGVAGWYWGVPMNQMFSLVL
ncbi:integral membrane protein DUF92-domain-containing protein [Coniochaeta sp. 2T2.1]|nr:integral membrane protein DUF92-domain-containing protein [Coniochaeta sp. 2T2.1]